MKGFEQKAFIVLTVILVVLVSVTISAQQIKYNHHNANQVYFDKQNKTFKQVVNNTSISNGFIGNFIGGLLVEGHSFSEIYVNVGGNTKTLLQAIRDKNISNTPKNKSPEIYGEIVFGELAKDIVIEINNTEKTLQAAINDGDFFTGCYLPGFDTDPLLYKISGSSWNKEENVACSWSCNCGKAGCSTCNGLKNISYTCLNGVLSVSEGECK